MGLKAQKFLAGVGRFTNFFGERDAAALKHWWDVYFVSRTKLATQDLFNQFVGGMKMIFDYFITRGQFSELEELFVIFGDLNPKLQHTELMQLGKVLEDKKIREKYLNIYLHKGRAKALEDLIDKHFKDYVESNPDNEDIQWAWRDVHEQLAGIAQDLPVDDY